MSTEFEAPSSFDVRVRLRPDHPSMHGAVESLDARPFIQGILQTLTVRTDDGQRDLGAAEVAGLGWDIEATWANAWAQTRVLEQPREINVIDASGTDIIHLYHEPIGASFVPYLADLLPIPEDGALVSMPIEHSIIVHPIRGAIVGAAQAMIPITRQVHRGGPDSLSAHLYWWRHGKLTPIPTYFARDGIEFYPPADLAELIDQRGDII